MNSANSARYRMCSRVPSSRLLQGGITPPFVRIDPPLGELIESAVRSRRIVRWNDSCFEPCGHMGADSSSSRVALGELRLRVLCVIGSAACSSPPPGRQARRTVRTGQWNGSRRGAGHAEALRQTVSDCLLNTRETHSLATCIVERQDLDSSEMFRLAS